MDASTNNEYLVAVGSTAYNNRIPYMILYGDHNLQNLQWLFVLQN